MTREWRSGDVAVIDYDCSDGPMRAAWTDWCTRAQHPSEPHWHVLERGTFLRAETVASARPLVVLDLPDGAKAGWPVLVDTFKRAAEQTGYDLTFTDLIAQIERQTEPPVPSRPDEPTDIGSWVTDGEGSRWVLMPPAYGARRWCRWSMSPPGTDSSNRSWTGLVLPVTVGEPEGPEAGEALPPDLIDANRCRWTWSADLKLYRLGFATSTRDELERNLGPLREVPHGGAVTS